MKDLFSPTPDDVRLAQLVSGPGSGSPSDFDDAAQLFGELACRARPVLIAIVARDGAVSPADIVDEAIETGWQRIFELFSGSLPDHAFRYVGPMSLASWLLLVIGRPAKPQNGGLIHKHLRSDRRREARETTLEAFHCDILGAESDEPDPHLELLPRHLALLEPDQHFVVSAYYGLTPENHFTPDGVRARCGLAGFGRRDTDAIVARARRTRIDPSKTKLAQDEIARLLDTSVKTVGRLLARAREELRETICAE